MKHLTFLLLTAFVLCTACKKENEMTVSNNHDILRCKINGQDWKPAVSGSDQIYPFELNYYSDIKRLELLAKNSNNNSILEGYIYIICNVDSLNKKNPIIFVDDVIANDNYSIGCNSFDLDTLTTNYIQVNSIDTLNYTIIGEFQFSAINDCQDTIRVTDGYFDLNYFF